MTKLYTAFEIPDPAHPDAVPVDLIPFKPEPLAAAQVVGRRIDGVSISFGTYGMGGPGFFALQLGEDWLVVALWGAASWMIAGGRLVEDLFADEIRPRPWISEQDDELSPRLVGRFIAAIGVARDALAITTNEGFTLAIEADPTMRPAFAGNGKSRAFDVEDDLRKSVFLCPSHALWV